MRSLRGWLVSLACVLFVVSALAAAKDAPSVKRTLKIPVAEYREKVYASWLGQCIGNIYGLPHENRHIEEPGPETWPYGYSGNLELLRRTNGVFSDDDTDVEYLYLTAMEKFGPEPSGEQLAGLWKYHMRDRVWLANRAALAAMHHGWTPPLTGMSRFNPHWFQIDPQLVNEIWAVTAPGMTRYAAEKSGWAARLTDDSWGIEPTIHYGAMYSAAFFESDVEKLIDIGTAALPPGSRFANTVEQMKALHRKYPDNWKQARAEMAKMYYIDEPPITKTIWNANLNGAAGILALLYGNGDFQRTLDLACAIGFDADNQAATMSGLVALIVGVKGLPHDLLFPFPEAGWKEPFNDVYKNVSRYDMPDASLRDMARRMAEQGEKIILAHGGRKVTQNGVEYYVIDPNASYVPPLELVAGPTPDFELGKPADYTFVLSGPAKNTTFAISSGTLPRGMKLDGPSGHISGSPQKPGIYRVNVSVAANGKIAQRDFTIIVHGLNLAPAAAEVLANVKQTDTASRDGLWLVVGKPMYANSVNVIRDGKRYGEGQSFFSLVKDKQDTTDFYGYRWTNPQRIGLALFNTGVIEENSGWFTTLGLEYQDASGQWKPVSNLKVSPSLPTENGPFDKPNFADYWLTFDPVETMAVRIIGNAGGTKHWKNPELHFTSISELEVYGPVSE
jgi:ADP-ribosylglycohydrolase/Putative Ig domain